MSMSKIMAFAAACLAASLAQAKVAAPGFVADEALFWLDASTLDAAAGTELDSWADARRRAFLSWLVVIFLFLT